MLIPDTNLQIPKVTVAEILSLGLTVRSKNGDDENFRHSLGNANEQSNIIFYYYNSV